MKKEINLDMDGTFVNFYGVDNWLEDLKAENTRPYRVAKPLVNMNIFAKRIHKLQAIGYEVNIISWTSKNGSADYNAKVADEKKKWLRKHLRSVQFDNIHILPYGTPKENYGRGILFDDEERNRRNWNGIAYDVGNILDIMKTLEV